MWAKFSWCNIPIWYPLCLHPLLEDGDNKPPRTQGREMTLRPKWGTPSLFEWMRIPMLSLVLHVFSMITLLPSNIQALNWWCSCRDTTKCEFYNMKIIKVYFQTMWIHAQVFAAADKKKRNWKRPRWPRLPATTHHGGRATEARSRQSNFPQQLIPISYFCPMTFLDNGNVFCDILW